MKENEGAQEEGAQEEGAGTQTGGQGADSIAGDEAADALLHGPQPGDYPKLPNHDQAAQDAEHAAEVAAREADDLVQEAAGRALQAKKPSDWVALFDAVAKLEAWHRRANS